MRKKKADELSEELGALVVIDKSEVNKSILSNFTKAKNNPSTIDSTSMNLSKIVEKLKKIGQDLSINSYMQHQLTIPIFLSARTGI
ncbi:hypothetical protein GLOIN_2v445174 [Rhizophagus irregularis DAOM 181602=DAOM 197198]|uniref:Uncharacterized protein n=1 Tax=Rhizophagus irregularis (strain DAOM 181602 / DAOM 197198 / MUCL 43194) TaxID=747089 RepID=A0A2P4PHW9_RHIID|nr:hypothetical protein GLOIN_2v445174 [Rhizophagus irregularis DAOM 181602=DAOM 197198]POG64996.1 hypothetical protein GLOIN_2v445174 [Rhizophagus irregularis DAOM 181602=DAOM 197198]|eukprot:XP_025171862.1 hypothetical protein GLOIN_2v445174 [Rhizophagus irregularis DAOM 181602=DAOM 197198]